MLVITTVREGDRGFRMPEPPSDYPFTLKQVLTFTEEQVIYEIHLFRIRRIRHYTHDECVRRCVAVIDWLLMVHPQLIGDRRTWQKINPNDFQKED